MPLSDTRMYTNLIRTHVLLVAAPRGMNVGLMSASTIHNSVMDGYEVEEADAEVPNSCHVFCISYASPCSWLMTTIQSHQRYSMHICHVGTAAFSHSLGRWMTTTMKEMTLNEITFMCVYSCIVHVLFYF